MRRFKSMQSRFFATLLSAALVTAPLHVALAAPSVEDLYTQGQEKFDAGSYGDAGDLWGQAVNLLPQNKNNSATRQTIMNLALDAYLRAYRGDSDRRHINSAKDLLDSYEAALEGTNVTLSDEIANEKRQIEEILADIAEADAEAEAAAAAEAAKVVEPPPSDPLPVTDDKPGRGLVIGGAVALGVGGAAIGLMLGGVIGSLSAQTNFNSAEPGTSEREDFKKRGETMNTLAIVGGVIAPLALGAGVALLIIGLKKNKQARNQAMVLPVAGPDYMGLGFSGRF